MNEHGRIDPPESDQCQVRPFSELRSTGLLWLINAQVLHPRGYALSLAFRSDDPDGVGEPLGWSILGDGSERWAYAEEAPNYDGRKMSDALDECFAAIKALMP